MLSTKLEKRISRIIRANARVVESRHIHFTFIVRKTKIVAWGFNKIFKTHTLAARFQHRFSDIHSELSAIANFPFRVGQLVDFQFVNVRLRRDNELYGLARPCRHCITMLKSFGISKICYSNEFGEFSYERFA